MEVVETKILASAIYQKIHTFFKEGEVYIRSYHPKFPLEFVEGRIKDVTTRGKVLILHFQSGKHLVIFFSMTGCISTEPIYPLFSPHHKFDMVFKSSKEELSFHYFDPRMFSKIYYVSDLNDVPMIKNMGYEIVDYDIYPPSYRGLLFNVEFFLVYLDRFRFGQGKSIKGLLHSQRVIAGLGNYLINEVLFQARIHPETPFKSLHFKQWDYVFSALNNILILSFKYGGVSVRDYYHLDGGKGSFSEEFKVYSRAGKKCLRCSTVIRNIKVAGRSSYFCPECQQF